MMKMSLKVLLILGLLFPGAVRPLHATVHPVNNPSGDVSEILARVSVENGMTDIQLRGEISDDGRNDPRNLEMKDAAHDFALLYHMTSDYAYAHKSAVILGRFAEVFPGWPVHERDGSSHPQDGDYYSRWDGTGLWCDWYYMDLETCQELVLAYDLIYNSGAMEDLGAGAQATIESDLIRRQVEVNSRWAFNYGNMEGDRLEGLVIWGRAAIEPGWVHQAVTWYRAMVQVAYYADGIWGEGSPAYHAQITGRMVNIPNMLAGYSDPAGYISPEAQAGNPYDDLRFDTLDLNGELGDWIDVIRGGIHCLCLPNDYFLAVHDSQFTKRDWYGERTTTFPMALFDYGHAVMGSGTGADQFQAHLHFSGTHGHDHLDCLNIVLWDFDREMFSETDYYGVESTRDWNEKTAAHNTVVVNEEDQLDRFTDDFGLGPDDDIPWVPNWPHREFNSDTRHKGDLLLWEQFDNDEIQVVEVEGSRSYLETDTYRRLVVAVKFSGDDYYLVDIFRVRERNAFGCMMKGMTTYDWMLHGNLGEDYTIQISLPLSFKSGTHHGHLGNLWRAYTDEAWNAEIRCPGGETVKTIMMGSPNTEVIVGDAPAIRRSGNESYLDVRRVASDSVFIAVHEPYQGAPRIESVEPLVFSPDDAGAMVAGVRVTLAGGRRDTLVSTMDDPAYPVRATEDGSDIEIAGRLGFVTESGGEIERMLLARGSYFRVGTHEISGDTSYSGAVNGLNRLKAGANDNSIQTAEALPTDAELEGRTMLLDYGDGATHGFTIRDIHEDAGDRKIRIYLQYSQDNPGGFDEPGQEADDPRIEFRDNGSLVKMMSFPNYGIRGGCSFLIPGSAFVKKVGESYNFVASGQAQFNLSPHPSAIR
ncbi:heparinase II/III family protein [Thermodesulfobacteriota bacterium]